MSLSNVSIHQVVLNGTNVTSIIGRERLWFECKREWPGLGCLALFQGIFWLVPVRLSSVRDYIFGIWQVWRPILPKDGDFVSPMLQRRKVRKLTCSIISYMSQYWVQNKKQIYPFNVVPQFQHTSDQSSLFLQNNHYLIQHQQVFPPMWLPNQILTSGTASRNCGLSTIKKMKRLPQEASLPPPWTRRPWGCGCHQRRHQTWQTEGWQEWHFG